MKHLERAYIGNNFMPWYLVILVLILFVQALVSLLSLFIEDIFSFYNRSFTLLLLMIPFAISLLFFSFLVKKIHKRSIIEVINGRKKIRTKRLLSGFAVWMILMLITNLISFFLNPDSFTFQFDIYKFIPLLLVSLLFIPLQAAFEEIIFRGYIMQGVASYTGSRWIALIVSSLMFAFLHKENPEIWKYGQIMFFSYLCIALIWGLVTILDDGAEISIGMHIANNLFISLFITERGAAFETDAVFETTHSDPYWGLLFLFLSGIISLLFFGKKYKWKLSTLCKKVEKPANNSTSVN